MNYVLVTLQKDRTKIGQLQVIDSNSGEILHTGRAYGKCDNKAAIDAGNPTRNPVGKGGDTPCGLYVGTWRKWWIPATPADVRSYGNYKIDLNPLQALEELPGDMRAVCEKLVRLYSIGDIFQTQAAQAERNGRAGILGHGGALGANGVLRPTNGCVREVEEEIAASIRLQAGPMLWVVREV